MENSLIPNFSHTRTLRNGEIFVFCLEDFLFDWEWQDGHLEIFSGGRQKWTSGKWIKKTSYQPPKENPYEVFKENLPEIKSSLQAELEEKLTRFRKIAQAKPFWFGKIFAEVFYEPEIVRLKKALKRIYYAMNLEKGDRIDAKELRERLDFEAILSQHTRLAIRGQEATGLCPFHSERTPSFTANLEKKLWYCFGCGESGDIFNFIMKKENLDFKQLMAKYGNQTK